MSITLMLPCRASDWDQIEARMGLLEHLVGEDFPIGLELMGPFSDFLERGNLISDVMKNSRRAREMMPDLRFSLHAPFDGKNPMDSFLTTRKENLHSIIKLAENLRVSVVTFHASHPFSYEGLKDKSLKEIRTLRKNNIKEVAEVFGRLEFSGLICIENGTGYIGDETGPTKKIRYAPAFSRAQDFIDLNAESREIVSSTVDICHLSEVLDPDQLMSELRKFEPVLRHFHLSDGRGHFRPFFGPAFEEGLIPGRGKIGEKGFKNILRFLLRISESRELGLVIEVLDKDYVESESSREALKILVEWLRELQG